MLRLQAFIVLLAIICPSLVAQSEGEGDYAATDNLGAYENRYAGDLGLQVNGYLWVPLFNIDPKSGIKKPNLALGGGGDLAVAYYLTPRLGIGGFLDLGISSPANQANLRNYFLAIMLGPRISYDINIYTKRFQTHPLFTLPLGFGLGISAAKYGEIVNAIPVAKLDLGIYVNPFNEPEWSFGLSLHYWFAVEFTKTELSRMANYLTIGIGFSFHSSL